MSYFAFTKDDNGHMKVTDQEVLEGVELLINQIILLNMRFEEAFKTRINIEDIDDAPVN